MDRLFEQQVAVITGAGSGIGFAIARQLCLEGASVVLNDIAAEKAENAADAIRAEGGSCVAIPGDAGEMCIIHALIDQAVRDFGRLDLCVANAGITCFGDFFSFSPEAFQKIMNLNLSGAFFLTQTAALQMRTQGKGGKILLMSSNIGLQSYPHLTAYSMSKAALQMMARSLVLDLSPYQITINALAPGATITPRTLEDDPQYESNWQQLIPLQKVAQPQDIAQAALFLLSPAASHITGHTLVIDGGWTQQSHYPSVSESQNALNL